jgi:DNA-directed RNA polymerase subunit L
MEIKILTKTQQELKIEIEGEGHTFCNVVQNAILKNKNVELAGYDIKHPLTASPTFYVRVKGRSKPEVLLKKAIAEVEKDVKVFRSALEEALNEWQNRQTSDIQDAS